MVTVQFDKNVYDKNVACQAEVKTRPHCNIIRPFGHGTAMELEGNRPIAYYTSELI